jgi:SAM-dependent methyltransferase
MSNLSAVSSIATVPQTSPLPGPVPVSPYQFKADPYSSHSVILSLLGEGHGRTLLDVGAAQGFLSEMLSLRGYKVTALEGNPTLAEAAVGKCHKVVMANLNQRLPVFEAPFDVIVYGDVLEHLEAPLAVLKAINKNLTANGLVLISVPNVAHLWVRIQLLIGRFEYADRGILDRTHLHFFTLGSFKRFLAQADLFVTEIFATPVPLSLLVPERYQGRLFKAFHWLNTLLARAWKSLFGYQFVAVARKGKAQ